MAVYTAPSLKRSLLCIVCHNSIPVAEAITGSTDQQGDQAFACLYHFGIRDQWINAWALYDQDKEPFPGSVRPSRNPGGRSK